MDIQTSRTIKRRVDECISGEPLKYFGLSKMVVIWGVLLGKELAPVELVVAIIELKQPGTDRWVSSVDWHGGLGETVALVWFSPMQYLPNLLVSLGQAERHSNVWEFLSCLHVSHWKCDEQRLFLQLFGQGFGILLTDSAVLCVPNSLILILLRLTLPTTPLYVTESFHSPTGSSPQYCTLMNGHLLYPILLMKSLSRYGSNVDSVPLGDWRCILISPRLVELWYSTLSMFSGSLYNWL